LSRLYGRVTDPIVGRHHLPNTSPTVAREIAALARQRIANAQPDLIFWPAGSVGFGSIPRGIPAIYSSDATFRLVENYHPNYRNLRTSARRNAEMLERSAIRRADLIVYPTAWAAQSAIEDYGAEPEKVHVVPFGANILDPPSREKALRRRDPAKCKLLLVGTNWREKGVDVAVDALRALRAKGINAELTVCGCQPPEPLEIEGLTILGFLDKSKPSERVIFRRSFLEADFFIFPTRADCCAIVLQEAAACGVPSIAAATGGVPGNLRVGQMGQLLPIEAGGNEYAEWIASVFRDPSRHAALRASARDAFEGDLNWDSWGRTVARLALETFTEQPRQPARAPDDRRVFVGSG
jgi:glycosyltransferase involved in cell wall biosynthesis